MNRMTEPAEDDVLYTVKEALPRLGMGRTKLHLLVKGGQIKTIRHPRADGSVSRKGVRIAGSEIRRYLAAHEQNGSGS